MSKKAKENDKNFKWPIITLLKAATSLTQAWSYLVHISRKLSDSSIDPEEIEINDTKFSIKQPAAYLGNTLCLLSHTHVQLMAERWWQLCGILQDSAKPLAGRKRPFSDQLFSHDINQQHKDVKAEYQLTHALTIPPKQPHGWKDMGMMTYRLTDTNKYHYQNDFLGRGHRQQGWHWNWPHMARRPWFHHEQGGCHYNSNAPCQDPRHDHHQREHLYSCHGQCYNHWH